LAAILLAIKKLTFFIFRVLIGSFATFFCFNGLQFKLVAFKFDFLSNLVSFSVWLFEKGKCFFYLFFSLFLGLLFLPLL